MQTHDLRGYALSNHALSVESLRMRKMEAGESLESAWGTTDVLLPQGLEKGRYRLGFATSDHAIEAVQRLRYAVFNVELQEGLAESHATGLDRDEFDGQMAHLVLMEMATGQVLGTYRLQTGMQAQSGLGYYSAQEYALEPLASMDAELVECGRACIAAEHRNFTALLLLWQGIKTYAMMSHTRFLFGCCSITTQDEDDGWRAMKTLRAQGSLHPTLRLRPTLPCSCGAAEREFAPDLGRALKLPKLFRTYLKLGALVISEPAIDRSFGTVDFLIMLDASQISLSTLEVLV